MKQPNKNLRIIAITLVSMALIMTTFLFTSMATAKEAKPSPPNYLGLAQIGIIPTTIKCSHSLDTYISTGVIMINQQDQTKYIILQSKFGDEFCLAPINK